MKPPISGYFDERANPKSGLVDTGLYDPDAHDDQIVVMFETRADAQAAIDRLAAEGLAGDAVVTDQTADRANAGVNSEGGNTGLLGALKGLFAPDDEVHGLAEGVRRGHALLVIHPAPETRPRVVELLASSGPIDFDARLEQWRTAGWQALHAQRDKTATPPDRPRQGVRDPSRGGPAIRSYYADRPKTPPE